MVGRGCHWYGYKILMQVRQGCLQLCVACLPFCVCWPQACWTDCAEGLSPDYQFLIIRAWGGWQVLEAVSLTSVNLFILSLSQLPRNVSF